MSISNSILDALNAEMNMLGRTLTQSEFEDFVRTHATIAANTDVPGSTVTVLYSGEIDGEGTHAYRIARDLAGRAMQADGVNSQVRIIDNTVSVII